jgi:opacity protein-like surface antigen
MKKNTLCLLLALALTSSSLQAQDSKAERLFKTFRFGLFVGPTFNSLRPVASSDNNYSIQKGDGNVGFSFGINADYIIDERYTIISGLGLDWRGGSINSIFVPSQSMPIPEPNYLKRSNITYKSQFLTIPIGLKMKATEVSNVKIYVQTAFDLALTLSNKGDYLVTLANDSIPPAGKNVKLGKDDFAKMVPINLGWSIGLGAEYPVSDKNAVFATLLYRNGFIDHTVPKLNKDGYKFSDGNIRSNTFAIRIGYFF